MCSHVNRDFLRELYSDVKESINVVLKLVSKPYEELSDTEKFAIRYQIIVIAEALIAMALHIVRRKYNYKPKTPIHAISFLKETLSIPEETYNDVVNIVKLRNLLVHRYWIIDDRKIYENMKNNFEKILNFIERIIGNDE